MRETSGGRATEPPLRFGGPRDTLGDMQWRWAVLATAMVAGSAAAQSAPSETAADGTPTPNGSTALRGLDESPSRAVRSPGTGLLVARTSITTLESTDLASTALTSVVRAVEPAVAAVIASRPRRTVTVAARAFRAEDASPVGAALSFVRSWGAPDANDEMWDERARRIAPSERSWSSYFLLREPPPPAVTRRVEGLARAAHDTRTLHPELVWIAIEAGWYDCNGGELVGAVAIDRATHEGVAITLSDRWRCD